MGQRQPIHRKHDMAFGMPCAPPMCFQRLKQLGGNIRSAGKPKRQNSKLEKSRMAWNKLPRESQIFAMIWKKCLRDGNLT